MPTRSGSPTARGKPLVPPNNKVDPAGARHDRCRGGSALARNRKPEPAARHEQLLHPGRLWRRLGLVRRAASPKRQLRRRLLCQLRRSTTQPGVAPDAATISERCRSPVARAVRNRAIIICSTITIPGYFGDGSNAYTDTNPSNYVFTIPPTSVRHIGDELNDNDISLGLLRRPVRPLSERQVPAEWNTNDAVLQHLQLGAIFDLDHDRRRAARRSSEGHHGSLRRASKSGDLPAVVLRQAERLRRRPSGLFEAQSVRRLREEDRRRGEGQSRRCGTTPRSSSPSTKAAAIGTRAMFSRSTSSATAPAFR